MYTLLSTMKFLLVFSLSFACIYAFPSRIVNGTDAKPGEIPYIVSLRVYFIHNCGGSIVNVNNILTASHCVYPGQTDLSVQYGVVDISWNNHNSIDVSTVIRHEEFNPSTTANDIAVLKLSQHIPLGELATPVVLPHQGEQPISGSPSLLAGWGSTGSSSPIRLQKVVLQIYSPEDCAKAHGSNVDERYHLCSGVPEGWKGQCSGDSGGPLLSAGKQVGVVSWSVKPCAVVGYPGVYCRVPNYIDWINSKTA